MKQAAIEQDGIILEALSNAMFLASLRLTLPGTLYVYSPLTVSTVWQSP